MNIAPPEDSAVFNTVLPEFEQRDSSIMCGGAAHTMVHNESITGEVPIKDTPTLKSTIDFTENALSP